jgi:hypothetical protein
MDLPKGVEMGWQQLIMINASQEEFSQKYSLANERNITRFLLADYTFSGSLISVMVK